MKELTEKILDSWGISNKLLGYKFLTIAVEMRLVNQNIAVNDICSYISNIYNISRRHVIRRIETALSKVDVKLIGLDYISPNIAISYITEKVLIEKEKNK